MNDQITLGMQWSQKLSQAGSNYAADKIRGTMTAEDQAALCAFRDHQLSMLVGEIEDSQLGSQIRLDVAKEIYAELVAKGIRASLQDGKKSS